MHGLVVYVKEGFPFAQENSLETISTKLCEFLLMFSTGFTSLTAYFFFFYRSPSLLCTVFDSVSSNTDEVLYINPSANVFVFGDFNVHHKDWLTYSDGTDGT